ncbi:hypothetical protein MMC07_006787 [Pseudocyphellaria aurata]|nr:hypothetical protein [Pseudocyphellaria aurata]
MPLMTEPESPTMCMDFRYSWPCGHEERLGSRECLFADEPNLQNHVHIHQDLGDPGYPCPTCLPAPAVEETPNAALIAALQEQLDAWPSGAHPRWAQREADWRAPPRIPHRTGPQNRAVLRHLADILARTQPVATSGHFRRP